jgi:hypothetical protein
MHYISATTTDSDTVEKHLFLKLCLAINTEHRNTNIRWNFYFSFSNKKIKKVNIMAKSGTYSSVDM